MRQVLNSISITANTTKTLHESERQTKPQGCCREEGRPLLADWWQSITDYCSHWNLKGNWDFIWREGPFFGGRKTTRKRTKHSCYKAWIQNTGFQEKGKGPFLFGFIWVYFLFLKETYSTLTWPKSTSPSHPDFSVKSALPFHFGACCQTHRASEGLQGLFGWTDSVKRVLASIQWLFPNTVHITRTLRNVKALWWNRNHHCRSEQCLSDQRT